MTLHLVFSELGFTRCAQRRGDTDAVILIGDGVYAASTNLENTDEIYCLREDCKIRGCSTAQLVLIDYAEMVDLCSKHQPIMSWND